MALARKAFGGGGGGGAAQQALGALNLQQVLGNQALASLLAPAQPALAAPMLATLPLLAATGCGGGAESESEEPLASATDYDSEEARFSELQECVAYERDPDPNSERNRLIDLYENLEAQDPEQYTGNLYPKVLPPSATRSNFTAAAGHTARDPINNRTRWALQHAMLQYALRHGQDEMADRATDSTEWAYQIHRSAFGFANDTETIGRLPWALLTHVDVPWVGEQIGSVIYQPEAYAAAMDAGFTQLAMNPLAPSDANAAFDRAHAQVMQKKHDLGGEIINWTIETTNSPHGFWSLPVHGMALRGLLDLASWVTTPIYD